MMMKINRISHSKILWTTARSLSCLSLEAQICFKERRQARWTMAAARNLLKQVALWILARSWRENWLPLKYHKQYLKGAIISWWASSLKDLLLLGKINQTYLKVELATMSTRLALSISWPATLQPKSLKLSSTQCFIGVSLSKLHAKTPKLTRRDLLDLWGKSFDIN